MKISLEKIIVILLLTCSIAVHFAFFGYPKEVVFDEVYFGRFISAYEKGEYFFDIHPPLGKLIVFGFVRFFDNNLESDFSAIGNAYVDHEQFFLRFLPCLAGSLIPIVLFYVALKLHYSLRGAVILSILLIFENSLVIQTHFLFLDGFLILFGFLAMLMYIMYCQNDKTGFLLMSCVFGSLAVSIKWTGVTFIFLILLHELFIRRIRSLQNAGKLFLFFFVVPSVIYFTFFVIHFALLSQQGTEGFLSLWEKFLTLNYAMYISNESVVQGHAYGSMWYTWPMMIRPVYYWTDGAGKFVYFFGNFVVWFLGAMAVIWAMVTQCRYRFRQNSDVNILLVGFFVNWVPFLLIDRVMFLYHYMISLIFSIMIAVYLLDKKNVLQKIDILLVAVTILGFLAFYPITYGVDFFL